jgi:hypothetical protein
MLIFLYEVHVYDLYAIIIKSRRCGSPKNYNNHAVIHEHLINLNEVHACNPDVIIIQKLDALALP